MQETQVILVDVHDSPIGVMEKMEAHRQGVLHRAFSIFLFNEKGEMLLQQRALSKYHSAGLWTNACCSHPYPGEDTCQAAIRRLNEELGFTTGIHKVFDFTYEAKFDNGLTEHEYDHVYQGSYDGLINANPEEVMAVDYLPLSKIQDQLIQHPQKYTAWFRLAFPMLKERIQSNNTGI